MDDDAEILLLVRSRLEHAGYEVWTAASGAKALEIIGQRGLPHLAIVDLRMPGTDGFEFCRAVQQFCDLPIILLTAVDDEDTIIVGIQRYAEDYIVKPFSPRELVARVERVLRRIGDFAYALEPEIRVDEHLAVDFARQTAIVGQQPVLLTPTETKLLYILMRHAGRTVTTDFLLRRLWPLEDVAEDSLRVHVHRVRQKIEPAPAQPRYLLTERGTGYRFPAPAKAAGAANRSYH
ncbi:MAG: response regulator transcription factor [Anaerolineae bacterium]